MTEIKPCPFCGGEDDYPPVIFGRFHFAGKFRYVRCEACDAEGPKRQTDEEAAEAWNRRAEPQE